MKYYRYMSFAEFVTILQGGTIESSGRCNRCRTTSNGVCFLGEHTDVKGHDYSAIDCFEFLSGIVSEDILVEFEADLMPMNGIGCYAIPEHLCSDYAERFYGKMSVQEYYVHSYSRSTFTPVAYYTYEEYEWGNRTELKGDVRIPVGSDVYLCMEM